MTSKKHRNDAPVCRKEDCFFESAKGSYYTCLTLPIIQKDWYEVAPKCKEWQIRVGQTVAVACNGATTPYIISSSTNSDNNPWFPFHNPWAPVQVLALYQTPKGKYMVSFRWLYWHDDVKESLKKNISKRPNQVFEHWSKDSFEVMTALGPIYLSSNEEKMSQHAVRGKDGMPRVFLTCRHAITKKGGKETLESVNDWNGRRGVPTSALDRALSLYTANKDLTLQQETKDAMQSMMDEDDDDSTVDGATDESDDDESSASDSSDAQSDSIIMVHSSQSSCEGEEQQDVKTPHSTVTDSTAASSSSLSNVEPFYTSDGVSYYWNLSVPVRKEAYYKKGGIKVDHWTLQVGDLIALEHEASSKPSKNKPWFPFKTPWSPAQVLALSHDEEDGYQAHVRWLYRYNDFEDLDDACNEVKSQLHEDQESSSKIVYEFEVFNAEDLENVLGRVVLTSDCNPSEKFLKHVKDEEGIPQAPLICRSFIAEEYDEVTPIYDWNQAHTSGLRQLQRGLSCLKDKRLREATLAMLYDTNSSLGVAYSQASSHSSPSESTSVVAMDVDDDPSMKEESSTAPVKRRRGRLRKGTKRPAPAELSGRPAKSARGTANNVHRELFDTTLDSFVKEGDDDSTKKLSAASPISVHSDSVASPVSNGDKKKERIFIPNGLRPFHEDFAALRSYYSEIQVVPPRENYAVPTQSDSNKELWTVKLGDPVVVHYKKGAGGNARANFPYKVAWAVAEVVTIWKEHESAVAMKTRGKSNLGAQDDVMIEIRWFYRKKELPGSAKTDSSSERAAKHVEYEEIFETDLMDECEATSLLGPLKLHESTLRVGLSKMQQGMPVIDVHCSQFWSIHRKSLVPCGGITGRVERGRMHSKYFGKGGVFNAAWREFKGGTPGEYELEESIRKPKNWKRAFEEVIKKLGLSAASEEASIRGIHLTGREAEQEKIMTFLLSRISGAVDEDGSVDSNVATNASLFVAGPPGTGKTASVHSVIARLRKEQAKGKLPAFEFVSLNGMEMRHPFEAYVKFWEVISGTEKQKCPPEIAVVKLERHFAGRGRDDEDGKNSSQVVVLLLDEIDYLVTKKQTVLYNFFDWPRRTCENGSGPRLIVVGISNTLNLPSRLKPSVQSRLGGETCGYKSYNVKDMIAILKTKVQSNKDNAYEVFEDDAIQFAARKTAALSGDIRKALHICKAAAEAVMKEVETGTRVDPKSGGSGPIVRISDVQKASRESFSSILSKAVAFSTSFEALLLVSLASLTESTGRHDGGFDINELITKMEAISGGSGDVQYSPPPTFGETLEMLNRLGETRLVSLHTPKSSSVTFRAAQGGSGGAWPLISLPMDSRNLLKALRDTPHSTLADKYLGSY